MLYVYVQRCTLGKSSLHRSRGQREMARLDAKLSMYRKPRSVARYFLTIRRIDFITIILVSLKEGRFTNPAVRTGFLDRHEGSGTGNKDARH